MKIKLSKETVIGIFAVGGIALLFWGINFLKGTNLFYSSRYYYAIYERVDGLEPANPVKFNGYQVGQVKEVFFHPSYDGRIVVKFSITEKGLKIKKDAVAKIISADLLGTKAIDIDPGRSPELLKDGDTLRSDIEKSLTEEVNAQILPLKIKAEGLIQSIDSAVTVFTAIFNEDARMQLQKSFQSIQRSISTFEKTAKRIDTLVAKESSTLSTLMRHVNNISANIDNNQAKINNIINNISAISDTLAAAQFANTIYRTNLALKEFTDLLDKINRGEGTIGALMNNDTLYKNIEAVSRDLDLLLEDMRLHPGRYIHFSVFGKKDKNANPANTVKYGPEGRKK
ncbi:MAG: mammalian cell entry protein [Vicingaceae bacterium]|nr:MAG: mammalian cell entry protein [Vicingaceae bacterium]